jgi:hypothetical protein
VVEDGDEKRRLSELVMPKQHDRGDQARERDQRQ